MRAALVARVTADLSALAVVQAALDGRRPRKPPALIVITADCKTVGMGRFASTAGFYARYREPYSPEFFRTVAERLHFTANEELLDVGCGPAPLAIGFVPFVRSCTGIDPEPDMIKAAHAAAESAHLEITFHLGRIEDFVAAGSFDVVTIGRALHWLDRPAALKVLEGIVSAGGQILVCRSASIGTNANPWLETYQEVSRIWSDDPDRLRSRPEATEWFAGSRFRPVDDIVVTETRRVSIENLIGRALSRSNTSPAVLGNRQAEFAAAIRRALTPLSDRGEFEEEIAATAAVFGT